MKEPHMYFPVSCFRKHVVMLQDCFRLLYFAPCLPWNFEQCIWDSAVWYSEQSLWHSHQPLWRRLDWGKVTGPRSSHELHSWPEADLPDPSPIINLYSVYHFPLFLCIQEFTSSKLKSKCYSFFSWPSLTLPSIVPSVIFFLLYPVCSRPSPTALQWPAGERKMFLK